MKDICLLHVEKSCLFSGMYLCVLLIASARLSYLPAIYSVLYCFLIACMQVFLPCSSLLLELKEGKSNLWYFRLALCEQQQSVAVIEMLFTMSVVAKKRTFLSYPCTFLSQFFLIFPEIFRNLSSCYRYGAAQFACWARTSAGWNNDQLS